MDIVSCSGCLLFATFLLWLLLYETIRVVGLSGDSKVSGESKVFVPLD